jgi:hypothetical protein
VAGVYRKWVLNEHGWYSAQPWSLAIHDLAAISSEDFLLRIPRKLLPCLSSDVCGQSLGVVVEVRCGGDAPWRRWTGPVWVSGGECAVWLGGDSLPADFFQAAVEDDASVRVTATVSSDLRLTARVAGSAGCPAALLDLSRRAAWRQVHPTSIFHQAQGLGAAAQRDDSLMLDRLARACAQTCSHATQGELTLGWIDTSFHPGDIIERISGRWLELSSGPRSLPVVRSVRHEFAGRQCTTITVSG